MQMGPTSVKFVDSRIGFGAVPINLMTTKFARIHNSGYNHAYFQVIEDHRKYLVDFPLHSTQCLHLLYVAVCQNSTLRLHYSLDYVKIGLCR